MKRGEEKKLIFEAALVAIFYVQILKQTQSENIPVIDFYHNYEEIDQDFGSCKGFSRREIDAYEARKLVVFANLMKVALLFFPNPKGKKAHLLDLVTRVAENKEKKYVTGSGQTINTSRRVILYEKFTGVIPVKVLVHV